jgi:hypothetical protein
MPEDPWLATDLIGKKKFVGTLPSLSHWETSVPFLGRKWCWFELVELADYGDRKKTEPVLGICDMGLCKGRCEMLALPQIALTTYRPSQSCGVKGSAAGRGIPARSWRGFAMKQYFSYQQLCGRVSERPKAKSW